MNGYNGLPGVCGRSELGEAVASGMSTITSRFSSLNPQLSPVSMLSIPQIVVKSPTSYEAPIGSKDVCPAADWVVTSGVSCVPVVIGAVVAQLGAAYYDFDTMDVFPMYAVSPRNDGYFPSVIPISPPNALSKSGSPVTPATGSLMNEASGSFDSAVGSPVTSLSITDYTADLNLLSEPLIQHSEVMLLQPTPAPVWPHTYPGFQPSHTLALSVDPSPAVLSCEGPFDAFTEPSNTSDRPLISFGLTRCPYRMMTYREEDVAQMDTAFGMQLHHPRFLECIGAPESARLLGRPQAEWPPRRPRCSDAVAAGRRTNVFESDCPQPICGVTASNVDGGYAVGVWSGILPLTIDRRCYAGAMGPLRFHSDGGHGFMASTG